jgi:hypothetical protein
MVSFLLVVVQIASKKNVQVQGFETQNLNITRQITYHHSAHSYLKEMVSVLLVVAIKCCIQIGKKYWARRQKPRNNKPNNLPLQSRFTSVKKSVSLLLVVTIKCCIQIGNNIELEESNPENLITTSQITYHCSGRSHV